MNKKGQNKVWVVLLVEILSLAFAFGWMLGVFNFNGRGSAVYIGSFVDFPSIIILILLSLPTLISSGLWKDFLYGFQVNSPKKEWKLIDLKRMIEAVDLLQKQMLYSCFLVSLFEIVYILHSLDDLATLGPKLAVIILTGFYTVILELLLTPLRIQIKKRIIEFMEGE